jgi:multidrug efflux pump subunit AcrA (membrane-fusion protein)
MDDANPRFRQDLAVATTEADGVPCVDVSDASTGASFRFYDFEYQLALQLNGQPLDQVIAWASLTYGVDLTADGIGEFAGRLSELGFLEKSGAVPIFEPISEPPSDPGSIEPVAISTEPETASSDTASPSEPDSAEDEWMSPEGTKTAQFVPDLAMLEGAPDLTPVAPLDLLIAKTAPEPEGQADLEMPAIWSDDAQEAAPKGLPHGAAAAAAPVARAPAAPMKPADLTESGKSRWAVDLDGVLEAPDSPAAVTAPTPPAKEILLPPRPVASPAPAGTAERRQPPPPEAVVMAGFSVDITAKRTVGRPRHSGRLAAILVLLFIAVAGAVGYYVWMRQHVAAPQALRVRVFAPKPAAIYRWFSGRGEVTDYQTSTLGFATAGRLFDLVPAGTEVAAGDVIGKLQAATALETLLAHDRSRVGFYRQMRDSMRAAGNLPELRQAEIKLADKQRLVDETTASLAKLTIQSTEPGEVVETLAKIGTPVAAGTPVIRVKGRLLHGAFELDAQARADLAKLDFCRVEVVGLGPRADNAPPRADSAPASVTDSEGPSAQPGPRFIDCLPPAGPAAAGAKVEVALPGDLGLVSGQPLRLARRRYDAVFPVPASALVGEGDRKFIWIAGRDGRAEARAVAIADLGDEALVSDGLRVGDEVIVDPPSELRPGSQLAPSR